VEHNVGILDSIQYSPKQRLCSMTDGLFFQVHQ